MGVLFAFVLGALQFLGSIGSTPVNGQLVAESHGGKWAVAAHYDNASHSVVFEVVDRRSGHALWSVPGAYPYSLSRYDPQRITTMVAFSPDDERIAVGGTSLSEYDVQSHRLLWRHSNLRVNAVAYSPDGAMIAAGGALPIVAAFESATGVERWRASHGSIVISIAVDPRAQIVASGSDGGGVRLWNMSNGRELPHLRIPHLNSGRHMQAALQGYLAHEGRVLDLGFTANGALITGAGDGSLRLWDPLRGRMLAEHICPDAVSAIAISSAGAVASCFDSGPAIFDPGTLRVRQYFGEDNGGAVKVWPVPDGWLVLGGDGTIKKWNGTSFAIKTLAGSIASAALSPRGDRIAYTYGDRMVHIASVPGGAQVAQISGVTRAKYGCCYGRSVMLLGMANDAVFVDTYSSEGFVDHHGAYHGVLSAWDLKGRKLATYDGVAASQIAPLDGGRFLSVTAPAMTDTPWTATLIDRRTDRISVWQPAQTLTDRLTELDRFNSAAPVDDGGPAILTEIDRNGNRILQERELPSGRIVRTLHHAFMRDTHGIVQDRHTGAVAVLGLQDGLTVLTLGGDLVSRNAGALLGHYFTAMDASGGHIVILTQPHNYGCDGSYHLRVFSERSGREIDTISRPACAQTVQLSDDGRVLAVQTAGGVDLYAVP